MTSTLQQEASRKFGFGARQTMNAAQRLYEAGHITYMRTDGIDMAPEAVMAARDVDQGPLRRGLRPVESPRMYKNKAKNAQEAHECIRPTDMGAPRPASRLEPDQCEALRPDLEARDRQPDGGRPLRAHHRRRRQRRQGRWACAPPARS